MQSGLAYVLTWTLLFAAPKPVLELISQRRRGRAPHSDADQLARLTHVPAGLWAGGFLVINCAGLVLGAACSYRPWPSSATTSRSSSRPVLRTRRT